MIQKLKRYDIIKKVMPCVKYGCLFRLVDSEDAVFIHKLRTDPVLSMYISSTEGDVKDQVNWIIDYKRRESAGEEVYIINIDPETGDRLGVNRLYNFRENVFELGSWLYFPQADVSKSILGDIFAKELGYNFLGFDSCTFEVRMDNKSVVRYHNSFSPELTGQDEKNVYLRLPKDSFELNKHLYLNICGYGQH